MSRRFLVHFLTAISLATCSATATVRANGLLGSLYDTCLSTLGEPTNYAHLPSSAPGSEVYAFRRDGWWVTIYFWKHQAHLIVYEKTSGANLSPSEVDAILTAYGNTQTWVCSRNGECLRRDGKAKANVETTSIALFSTEFARSSQASTQR